MNIKQKIEKAINDKKELSKKYDVPESSIVWQGNNNFIVVKDNKEIYEKVGK